MVNLFREPVGAPMPPDAVGVLVAAAARRAGLDRRVSPRQLRHALASNVVDSGGALDEVAELLGHASMSSSQGIPASRSGTASRRGRSGDRPPGVGRSDGMTPAVATATAAGGTGSATDLKQLLPPGCRVDGQARRLASLIDPEFPAEAGWNPARLVFNPPPGHRLLGRPICRAAGCETTATGGTRICHSCAKRLTASGLGEDQISLLPARPVPVRGVGPCRVTDCGRESEASTVGLCRWHRNQQHALRVTVEQFLSDPRARPLPAARDCAVTSCPRQRRHPDGQYCQAHQLRVRARRSELGFDETRWRLTDPPIGCGGQISLRGLLLVVVQGVLGLQRRCRADRVRTKEADLRAVVDDLRREQGHVPGRLHPSCWCEPGVQRGAPRVGPSRPPGPAHPGKRDTRRRLGPDGVRALGHRVVHRHHPALAAGGGEALGRR